MYISKHHQFNDREAIFELIESYPLGAWVCTDQAGLIANHIPFFLDRSKGPLGMLIGHVSRANDVWKRLSVDTSSMVLFQGPQSYITPGWYPGKAEHGKVVPTWNYNVVHVHGVARAIEDKVWLLEMLKRLTGANESQHAKPWSVSDAPADYIDKMLGAIVGIEIPVDRLEGKLKASQDEDMQDRIGTVKGLLQMPGEDAASMAALVKKAIELQSAGQ